MERYVSLEIKLNTLIFLDRNYFENFKYKFKYHYKCKNLKQAINYIKRKEKII